MKIDSRVTSLCAEYGIKIVPANVAPQPGQTRAAATIQRLLDKHGEGHLRMVLSTLAETKGNEGMINEYSLWAASDLIHACSKWIEADPEDWFQAWDKIPLGWIMWHCQELYGIVTQRQALAGAMYVFLVHYSQGRKANRDIDYSFMRRIQKAEGEPSKSEINREKAIEAGNRLLEVKAALPRGEFMAWVKSESGVSYATAQKYMWQARQRQRNCSTGAP
ncbi:DUF3102 domain-containing protein [Phyllobacteriaceae bacterium JZ32]